MSNDPDQIRADIERTRAELSQDVDAFGEQVRPSALAQRQVDKVKGSALSLKDRIMGTAHDAKDRVASTAHDAKDRVAGSAHDAKDRVAGTAHGATSSVSSTASSAAHAVGETPQLVRRQTEGNPLAAGLIAFGIGWLASSLLPSTRVEQDAARRGQDSTSGLVDEVKSAAQDVAQNLREPAQEAVQAVKDRASEAASTLKDEGTTQAQGLAEDAKGAKDSVQESRQQY